VDTLILDLLFRALTHEDQLYTGLSIKRFLKQHIPALNTNHSIQAGRWSAYCHFHIEGAIANLLDKHRIDGQKVLIHPLTPPAIISELRTRNCTLVSLDISKESWNIPVNQLRISLLKQDYALAILYGRNGLYEEITEAAQLFKQKGIPCLIYIDQKNINPSLIELWSKHNLGSIIWSYGDSFLDDHLNTILPIAVPSKNWIMSWYYEDRTRSVLEYHLQESFKEYITLLAAWYYILIQQKGLKNISGLKHAALFKFTLPDKFKNIAEAQTVITQQYINIQSLAVPDVIFDMQLAKPVSNPQKDTLDLNHRAQLIQDKARKLYNLVTESVAQSPSGSLEVPSYFLNKVYLEYFWYTTEPEYWAFSINQSCYQGFVVDTELNRQLTQAKFIAQYAFIVPQALEKYN
jgi:hypothetical protein